MNKITFPRTAIDGMLWTRQDIETWYVDAVFKIIKNKISKVNPTSAAETKTLNIIQNHLKLILKAQPQQLELWANIIDRYRSSLNKNFLNEIQKAFNYGYFRQNRLVELAKILNVKCCPYCNMHYTLYAEDTVKVAGKIKSLAKFQFDHFYDKSEYPMLSMSLYNLIPSCAVCNQGKSTTKLSLLFHPYHSDICKQFRFELHDPIGSFCGEKIYDSIIVDLTSKTNKKNELSDFEETFHLKALYQRHGDIAQEVFDKAYEYPYYSNSNNFTWLTNASPKYIKRLWMGTYTDENEIEKRPMTKFIQDLWEQALRIKVSPEDILELCPNTPTLSTPFSKNCARLSGK